MDTITLPIHIDEFKGSKMIAVRSRIGFSEDLDAKGFIPESDFLEEVERRVKEELSKDISEYDVQEIGEVTVDFDTQEIQELEVSVKND